jgi:sigma-B regulation protein RsbU (phosphoserine phosphatase)
LLLRTGGESLQLPSTGLPLGIIVEAEFGSGDPIPLAPGDALLLLSDGIFECETRSGTDLGIDPVTQTAHQHLGASAADMLEALSALTEAVSPNGYFRDDRTAVAAKRIL